MSWKQERDLLIAQTLAFVESVSGKQESAGEHDAMTTDAKKGFAPHHEAGPVEAMGNVTPKQDFLTHAFVTQAFLTKDFPTKDTAIGDIFKIAEPTENIAVHNRISPAAIPGDIRTEIQNRVAHFRAHQERFHREREEYFSATLAKARAAIADDSAPRR